jgi:hypothetical protein
MGTSLFDALCAGRMAQTGERQNTVVSEIRRMPSDGPPIPEAASADQAFLESCFLEAIGHCGKDRWRPHMLPFAVSSVTPRPDDLIVRIPREYLPDVLRRHASMGRRRTLSRGRRPDLRHSRAASPTRTSPRSGAAGLTITICSTRSPSPG